MSQLSTGGRASSPGDVPVAPTAEEWRAMTPEERLDFQVAVNEALKAAAELVGEGMNICPHPGPTGFGILGTNPNGMSVIDWARDLMSVSIPELEEGLAAAGRGPAAVFADAALTPLPHMSGGAARGASFEGVTLATTRIDVIRALLESIACEFSLTIERLRRHGIESTLVRATGGGSTLDWWLQLHADVCGIPFEVVAQDEPGAFGAAILAGVGTGLYSSVSSAVAQPVHVSRRFEPDAERGAMYEPLRKRLGAR